jgi:hypothetical protein
MRSNALVDSNISEERAVSIVRAVCYSETLVGTYKSKRRDYPEDQTWRVHHRKYAAIVP